MLDRPRLILYGKQSRAVRQLDLTKECLTRRAPASKRNTQPRIRVLRSHIGRQGAQATDSEKEDH